MDDFQISVTTGEFDLDTLDYEVWSGDEHLAVLRLDPAKGSVRILVNTHGQYYDLADLVTSLLRAQQRLLSREIPPRGALTPADANG